nr:iron-containing alcohol dehydrogenase [Bacteroidota bacterium]
VEEMKKEPQNTEIRNKILRASNIAGLAFSNTKTAAAHSISYPLTVNFNIPHGIAASLPLIPLLKLNKCAIENYLNRILKKLNLKKLSELEERIREIPDGVIKYSLKEWGIKANQLDELISQSFTKGRMDNNIVDLSKKDVYQIMKSIF